MKPERKLNPLILIVDDEPGAAMVLKHIMERENYQTVVCHDGQSAIDLAQKHHPDLILLDIMMPGMNGFEVIKALRDIPITRKIPTIVVSARAIEPSDVAKGLDIGADDYICKPFAPQELVARAKSKIRAKHLEDALENRTRELESLLRISDELNRHLEIKELLTLISNLVLEMLPCDVVFICQLDEREKLATYQTKKKYPPFIQDNEMELYTQFLRVSNEMTWVEQDVWNIGYPYGMLIPLKHSPFRLGLLGVASQSHIFNDDDHRLFLGIARQATLALHNAELNEIRATYAMHLEDMVVERTEELKAAQEMLFRSEKLASVGHLAANIAHEINNPLQPIHLNLEYLLEDIQHGHPVDIELITRTQESVERIGRIVKQLLQFTKADVNRKDEFSEFSISQSIEGIIKLNYKNLERNRVKVIVNTTQAPKIVGNRDQLEQVFMNLVINASDAMPSGGTLSISAWQEDESLNLEFKDTGIGISPENVKKIFDPFFSTKPEGTGLGLFVTYGIIEKHNGKINVRSKIGEGTTFNITLPLK
ncbi:MAG: response regulator [Phototrophicaceae bacterium]